MKRWNLAWTALLAVAAMSGQAFAQLREANTTAQGDGALRLGGRVHELRRATVVLRTNGNVEIVGYGSTSWRFTGRWTNAGRGAVDVRITGGENGARGDGTVWFDNRNRFHRLDLKGSASSGVFTMTFIAEGSGPWNDPGDWRDSDLNEQLAGNGTVYIRGRSHNVRWVRTVLRPNQVAEVTFGGNSGTFTFRGDWDQQDNDTIFLTIDRGPVGGANGRGTIDHNRRRITRIDIDGRDNEGRFEVRFVANSGTIPPGRIDDPHPDVRLRGDGQFVISGNRYNLDRAEVNLQRDGEADVRVFAGSRSFAFKGRWREAGNGWSVSFDEGLGSDNTSGTGTIARGFAGGIGAMRMTGRSGSGARWDLVFTPDNDAFDDARPGGGVMAMDVTRNGTGTVYENARLVDRPDSAKLILRRDGTFALRFFGDDRDWTLGGTYRLRGNQAELDIDRGFSTGEGTGTGMVWISGGRFTRIDVDTRHQEDRIVIRFTAR